MVGYSRWSGWCDGALSMTNGWSVGGGQASQRIALFLLFVSDGAFHVNGFRLGVEGLF